MHKNNTINKIFLTGLVCRKVRCPEFGSLGWTSWTTGFARYVRSHCLLGCFSQLLSSRKIKLNKLGNLLSHTRLFFTHRERKAQKLLLQSSNHFMQVPTWLPPHLCDKYRPQAFADKGYNTVDGILDCTEIYIETPSSFRVQSETYSTYKKHNTAKGLIVCSPNGFVTFVSDLAPGRLSDKALTKACGVLDKFTPGRSVMADRGFTISEECKQRSLHLNIPPFMEGRPQLSEEDEQETRHIASVRIHVERVIRRVKNFRILSHIFPNSMSEQLNKVWHVCARLTNFVDEPLL